MRSFEVTVWDHRGLFEVVSNITDIKVESGVLILERGGNNGELYFCKCYAIGPDLRWTIEETE